MDVFIITKNYSTHFIHQVREIDNFFFNESDATNGFNFILVLSLGIEIPVFVKFDDGFLHFYVDLVHF